MWVDCRDRGLKISLKKFEPFLYRKRVMTNLVNFWAIGAVSLKLSRLVGFLLGWNNFFTI